ncbi:hypothetical protein B0H21DRAFT_750247 [Amylocystis lapponica]|nr:hypothetical protein B0H21DRAFT_750247 [Amylocystis lapponica]
MDAPQFPTPHGDTPRFPTPHDPPAAPPPYSTSTPPPSGFRVALSTDAPIPEHHQLGPPVGADADGSPVFVGSALFQNSVHPCKVVPHLQPPCRVPYGGAEREHHGRYDLLPFDPRTMEWVPTAHGRVPPGRHPVEGGYEENGGKLYHALAPVRGLRVPGKTGEHLDGCNVAFGGGEVVLHDNYEILCWR